MSHRSKLSLRMCRIGGLVAQLLARRTIDREVESSNKASDSDETKDDVY